MNVTIGFVGTHEVSRELGFGHKLGTRSSEKLLGRKCDTRNALAASVAGAVAYASRLTIGLAEQGRAAARVSDRMILSARRALFVLVEIGRKMMDQEGKGNSVI
jgi:hypothetical protein